MTLLQLSTSSDRQPARRTAASAIVAFALAAFASTSAFGNSGGRLDHTSDPAINAGRDCSDCHGTGSLLGDPAFSRFSGPGTVVAGETVSLSLRVSQDAGNNRATCGFGLSATAGTLAALEANTVVSNAGIGSQLIHTSPLTSTCLNIGFEWTAPVVQEAINVTFYAGTARTHAGGPRDGDFAENASFTVTVVPQEIPPREFFSFGSVVIEGMGGVADMGNPTNVAVSNDGQNVHVTADSQNAIVTFDRDANSGELSNPRVTKDTANGGSADGLRGPVAVAIDASDARLYAATDSDNRVVSFDRDGQGVLSFVDERNPLLRGLTDIVLFPDEQVLAVSANDATEDGVALMSFDVAGREGLPTTFQTRRGGFDGIGNSEFPSTPRSLAASPDSRFLYVGGASPSGVFILQRDEPDLTMSLVGSVEEYVDGVQSLGAPDAIALSPDASHLYAISDTNNAIVVFERDAVDGTLDFVQALREGELGTTGLSSAKDVLVSPNGRFVYVAGDADDGSVMAFDRDVATGRLTFVDVVFESDPEFSGLRRATALASSPDGRHLYVAAQQFGPGTPGSVVTLPEPAAAMASCALGVLACLAWSRRRRPQVFRR